MIDQGTGLAGMVDTLFMTPAFLWFLAVLPVILILYLLKLRRTEVVISSTLLWLKSLQDLTANAPFQRLRKNLLLLLQLLIALALALALARPYLRAEMLPGQYICLLIDRSASMQTQEKAGTRLDLARESALRLVNEMRWGDRMMVVTFGETADVLVELTEDRVRLREVLGAIQATDESTRMRDAFFVAQSLHQTNPDLSVIVLTDGNVSDLAQILPRSDAGAPSATEEELVLESQMPELVFFQVGETRDNAGIVQLSMRKPSDEAGEQQTFALVHNESANPLQTTLTLYFNDVMIGVSELDVPPGADQEVLFGHGDLGEGLLRAELDTHDALAVDNQAWLAIRPAAKLQVLLVSEPKATSTFYLQRVFALDPRAELETVAPSNYFDTQEYDLVVFNGFAPPSLPAGSLLFFNAVPPVEDLDVLGELENPPVIASEGEHPVMRYLNPANVGIAKAIRLGLPSGARALASTNGGPLIADVSRGGQQILVVAFNLEDSDWPLNLSFPLFVQNVLSWTPRAALSETRTTRAGRPLALPPDPLAESATVAAPDGQSYDVRLDPMRPSYFAATHQVGPYRVALGGRDMTYAINLLDPVETAVAPAEALEIGRGRVEAQKEKVTVNREFWRWLVAAGIAILALEWWVYSRRAWV